MTEQAAKNHEQPDGGSRGDSGLAVGVSRRAAVRPISQQQPGWSEIISPVGWIKIIVIMGLFSLLFRHEYYRLGYVWLNDGNWSHGFLIPLFSLYFLNQHRGQLAAAEVKANYLGLAVLLLAVGMYLASIYPLKMGYPKLMAFLLCVFAIVLLVCGWKIFRIAALPIAFLFFAMPLPTRWYVYLTMPMRIWSSYVAASFLDAFPSIEATSQGVIIEGLYKGSDFTLNVAEACAGMRLMMAFVALGVAMAYLSDRSMWHRLVLLASTLPIAIFCNFVRVMVTGVVYLMIGPEYARGGYHTLLGLSMLPLAFGLYALISFVIDKSFVQQIEGSEA